MRYSKQREIISRNLKNRSDHPSADMVYASVKEQMPKISLGTVYRNLKGMAESGDAISFMVGGREHFDGRTAPHLHLCCSRCGAIEDRMVAPGAISQLAGDDFKVANVVLQGLCQNCLREEEERAAESAETAV